jgi:serine/threonine protein kinase
MARLDIDPAQWAQLNRLLDEALDRPASERLGWVDSLGDEYSQLKPGLRDLLQRAAGVETGEFLHTLPKFDAGALTGPSAAAGESVGPYRLVRELGSGGMGAVWLAERVDGLINRPVALKLPHLVAARSAGLAERMAREREILASLDHRNIARLLDAGVTADGQPFLALEYVEGVPIDRFCAEGAGRGPLDTVARLRLFRQVAEAVGYAHGKLVLHRDLKPTNILVTPSGGVKLLDFGIAKLLDEGKTTETRLTALSGRALTPDYASPEQISGEPLTVASDVYSLGVILFELLTGVRPYKLKRDSRGALEEAILNAEPARASQVAEAAARKTLRGDLDTILGKALKKIPGERYSTVQELSEDVLRYLDHRPVRAQPENRWYRLGKFIRRNRLAVGATSGTFVVILLAAAVAFWQMVEAREQRNRAETMRQRALATNEFLDGMLDELGRGGKPMTLAETLDRSTAILERNYDRSEATSANLLYEASRRYATLGKTERELQLLDRVAASGRKLGDASLVAAAQCSAAHALLQNDRAAANQRLAEVDALLQRGETLPLSVEWICARPRASILEADGQRAAGAALLEKALAEDLQRPPGERMPTQVRAALLGDVGLLHYRDDNLAKTLAAVSESIKVFEDAGRDQSMNMVITRMNYAAILTRAGEIGTAFKQQQSAMALLAQVEPGGEPPVGIATHLATSQLRLENFAEAARLAEEDAARARAAGNERAASFADLVHARALGKLRRGDEFERVLARAEQSLLTNPKANERLLNEVKMTRAEQALSGGDPAAALRLVTEVLATLQYPQQKAPSGLASVLYTGARAALATGDAAKAEQWASDAVAYERDRARDPALSANFGQAALNHAEALAAQGKTAQALPVAREAARSLAAGFSREHPDALRARALVEKLQAG